MKENFSVTILNVSRLAFGHILGSWDYSQNGSNIPTVSVEGTYKQPATIYVIVFISSSRASTLYNPTRLLIIHTQDSSKRSHSITQTQSRYARVPLLRHFSYVDPLARDQEARGPMTLQYPRTRPS